MISSIFRLLHDLKAEGATDYFALPVEKLIRHELHGGVCN